MKLIMSLLLACLLFSCSKRNSPAPVKSARTVVIHDLTDSSLILPPKADPIIAQFEFNNNKDQEAVLDYVLLTDKILNPVKTIRLRNAELTERDNKEDDPRHRSQLIAKFSESVRQCFNQFPVRFSEQPSLSNSECFATIASQLRKLANSKCEKKRLYVFSDLAQNSPDFSIYDSDNRQQLQKDPKAVGELLMQRSQLPKDLKGIEVYFCYQPRTKAEDSRFLDAAGMYEILLADRGAVLHILASNENLNEDNE